MHLLLPEALAGYAPPAPRSAVVVNRKEFPKPIELFDIRSQLGCEIIGVIPMATSASFDEVISKAESVNASFRVKFGKSGPSCPPCDGATAAGCLTARSSAKS